MSVFSLLIYNPEGFFFFFFLGVITFTDFLGNQAACMGKFCGG
jgi:hypothetical protein